MHPEQPENLERVESRIGHIVLRFCVDTILHGDSVFYMEELRRYVSRETGHTVAPDSPGRILRELRKNRKLKYTVVSRRESLYEINSIEEKG